MTIYKKNTTFGGQEFYFDTYKNTYTQGCNKDYHYSDGLDIEYNLHNLITKADDVSLFSSDLSNKIINWPTEYHLSPRRGNLIRPIVNLGSQTKVLELGCGCGAITRFLAEYGCKVDAVEGSSIRACITATRVRDCNNVNVFYSDFSNLKFEADYDIVLLIGVLEYSPSYFKTLKPFLTCLQLATQALNKSGVLIIAIENQLGLKYFSGIPEDHIYKKFYGIENRYKPNEPQTIGKKTLTNLLITLNYKDIFFNYPFPDYKLPQVIITDLGLNTENFNYSDLIRKFLIRKYEPAPDFDIDLVCDTIAREGILGDLSNSFLIFAEKENKSNFIDRNLLAEVYTDDRHPAYNTKTCFYKRNNIISVSKFSLSSHSQNDSFVTHIKNDCVYIYGYLLSECISRNFKTGNTNQAFNLLNQWINKLKENSHDGFLPPDWIDAVPKNFIYDYTGNLNLIDQEWIIDIKVNTNLVIFRGLRSIASDNSINKYIHGKNFKEKIDFLCTELGLEEHINFWLPKSKQINSLLGFLVYGKKKSKKYNIKHHHKNLLHSFYFTKTIRRLKSTLKKL